MQIYVKINHTVIKYCDIPINATDSMGLETWQCKRPIDSVVNALGQKKADALVYKYGIPTYHQYTCVGKNSFECGGLTPDKDNPIIDKIGLYKGKPTDDDYFDKNKCQKVQDDNECYEDCIKGLWELGRPNYQGLGVGAINCQDYDDSINRACRSQCNISNSLFTNLKKVVK